MAAIIVWKSIAYIIPCHLYDANATDAFSPASWDIQLTEVTSTFRDRSATLGGGSINVNFQRSALKTTGYEGGLTVLYMWYVLTLLVQMLISHSPPNLDLIHGCSYWESVVELWGYVADSSSMCLKKCRFNAVLLLVRISPESHYAAGDIPLICQQMPTNHFHTQI